MTLAVAILADQRHKRVAELATFLADADVRVCIHFDANGSMDTYRTLKHKLSQHKNIVFADPIACNWGEFSLVEAELEMCRVTLRNWPQVTHVQLISGDSLPIHSVQKLKNFLAARPDTDFIESVAVADNNWIVGGLGMERFTLRFPFSWKTQRRRFDLWVTLQRKLGLKRRLPEGIRPYIGSQWWCLTRKTIEGILSDPGKPEYDAYFRKTWIPDESYFQTLVRNHSRRLEAESLMYSPFDHQGKPVTFYDDHADMLHSVDKFFARKIWHGADGLYQALLSNRPRHYAQPKTGLSAQIALAADRRRNGRTGLRMIGRNPNVWHEPQVKTAATYHVLAGIAPVFRDINGWLQKHDSPVAHGRLFAPDRVHFANDAPIEAGGLSALASIRDNAPLCFLRNFIWQYQGHHPTFHFEPEDTPEIARALACDPNARIYLVEYGWIFDLAQRGITNTDALRAVATHMLMREKALVARLQDPKARCKLTSWTLGQTLADPVSVLRELLDGIGVEKTKYPMIMPTMGAPETGLEFARQLKNIGVDIDLHKLDTVAGRASGPALVSVNQ